jgi:serine protease
VKLPTKGLVAVIGLSWAFIGAVPVGSAGVHSQIRGGRQLFLTRAAARAFSKKKPGGGSSTQLAYGGGLDGGTVVTGAPRVYLVLWGSQWQTDDADGVASRLTALYEGIGTDNEEWSAVMTQYCEGVALGTTTCPTSSPHVGYASGGALAGIWRDDAAPAPAGANGHELALEAVAAARHFGNTNAIANLSAQYVIASPHGTTPDGFNTPSGSFCAWHDDTGDQSLSGGGAAASPFGDLAFTNLPYMPDAGSSCGENYVNSGPDGALDGVTIVAGHEYAESITDPHPFDGWRDANAQEDADKCEWKGSDIPGGAEDVTFANGSFAMQATWSNDTSECVIAHPIVAGAPPSDFSVGLSRTRARVIAGSSMTVRVMTTPVAGPSQVVVLTVDGLPPGASASFVPLTVTAGATAVLTIATSPTTHRGHYLITITGHGVSNTHTMTLALQVERHHRAKHARLKSA